eukprot:13448578-Alexandrium_andersonii.AAC.1
MGEGAPTGRLGTPRRGGSSMSLGGGHPPLPTGRIIQRGEAAAPTELELHSLNRHARNKPQR